MGDSAYILSLLVGLFLIIRFRTLGESNYSPDKEFKDLLPKKWSVLILQVVTLIVGLVFFIVSLYKLLA